MKIFGRVIKKCSLSLIPRNALKVAPIYATITQL